MDLINDQTSSSPRAYGKLYVVATPIGNLADVTFRALQILGDVALIAAEDTRHTHRLLKRYDIRNRMISFHEHNENKRTGQLMARLFKGDSVALVSNAGTPTLSDPGYRLVRTAAAANIRIVPIPGASAALASLSVSGLPTDAFVFLGFLPRKEGKRKKILASLVNERKTMIFYESPRRLVALCKCLIEILGDRQGVLSREMTKRHEEFIRGSLSEMLCLLQQRGEIKGECTLVVQGLMGQEWMDETHLKEEILQGLQREGARLSDLAKHIAARRGLPRKQVYEAALKIKASLNESG